MEETDVNYVCNHKNCSTLYGLQKWWEANQKKTLLK